MMTTMTIKRDRVFGYIILALFGLAFYIHNILSSEFHDDFVYKFFCGFPEYSRRIESVVDIFYSQVNHYFSTNGRTIVHVFVQLFTGILGKKIFNIVNSLVFMVFIYLLKRNLSKQDKHLLFSYSAIVALVLMMPSYNLTFIWMCGSINYLWAATGTLLFLELYDRYYQTPIRYLTLWLSILIFFLGWTHEAISFPLALSVFALNCLQNKIKTTGFWISLAFLMGSCMSALSPSTTARSGLTDGFAITDISMKIYAGFIILSKLRIIYITFIFMLVLWIKQRSVLKELITCNAYLLLAIIPALGIVFISGFDAARTAFGLELYCLILLLRAIGKTFLNHSLHINIIGATIFLGLSIFYGFVIYHAIPSWQETQNLIFQIQNNKDGIIKTNEHDAGAFTSFIRTMIDKDDSEYAMFYDAHNEWPVVMAASYHRDSLVFLPEAFLKDIKLNPNRCDNFDMGSPYEFFVKKIGEAQIDSVFWQLNPTDFSKIPFFFRPIAKRLGRYVDNVRECEKWTILYLYGQRYLVVKKEHAWDKRLNGILVIERESEEAIRNHYQKAA